jgi:methyl-accepting chemotaxis protein
VSDEINRNVANISEGAHGTSSLANDALQSSSALLGVANQLKSAVGRFKVE